MALSQDWTPSTIRDRQAAQGFRTLTQLARRVGLNKRAVSAASHRPHDEGERAIAWVLCTHAAETWPARYERNGERLSPRPPASYGLANYGRDPAAGHGQSGQQKAGFNPKAEVRA
ncbi:helix-turn-helix domain-containing protein [Algihabitans sp.]|uniref:helix-turn-helix domain-containing protein n=1 Tax=Algihabitans sp. TaxID=2821514 RepID=UPI003BABA8A9